MKIKIKSTKTLLIIFLVVAGLLVGSATLAFYFYKDSLKAVDINNTSEILFAVNDGDTIKTIAPRLLEMTIIKNKVAFELAARVNNKEDIAAGMYPLSLSMDVGQILNTLTDPTKAITDQVVVTLIEGYWAKDMARVISEKCNISAEALLALWNNNEFINTLKSDYWFINDETVRKGQRVMLEGYLYPDTYYFFADSSAETITYKLLDRFEEVVTPFKDRLSNFAIKKKTFNLNQILTLASIVQFESGNYEDMPAIAGVFVNRLNDGMALQSSVTVCYVLYNYKSGSECELYKNQQIDSPYNTYVYKGLPLGPILNPSIEAIKAVLDYQENDYYYFIGDNNGIVRYAKTFAEHEANIAKYLR